MVVIPFAGTGQKGIFEGDSVKILGSNDEVIEERKNPRMMFKSLRRKFYWDNLDALYFGGYALWNYLNLPFLLASPDIEVKEIESWEEYGKVLRRVLASAIACGAEYLITGDKKDFAGLRNVKRYNLKIVSPSEFIETVFPEIIKEA